MVKLLIVGGTSEGRLLAELLVPQGFEVVTSLAGRTTSRTPIAGEVRVGNFGGPTLMAAWLSEHSIDAVVDASHPFAATMTSNTALACAEAGVPLLRLNRPSWRDHRYAGEWTWVADHAEALKAVEATAGNVWLTIGRQHAADYAALAPRRVIARVAEAQDLTLPASFDVVEQRGPFHLADERAFIAAHEIHVLVSKDSGGSQTDAKLTAAHEAGVRVVMLGRPPGPAGLEQVESVQAAVSWVRAFAHGR